MSLLLDGTLGVPVTTVTGTLPVANGGTGVATSTGSGAVVLGTSPSISGAVMSTMASSVLTSATAQNSTSGTSIDFTGIPSWVKRITVMFNGVSVSGTSSPLIQLGDSGGIENTGYSSISTGSVSGAATVSSTSTAGYIATSGNAANVLYGSVVLTTISSNLWVASGVLGSSASGTNVTTQITGAKSLSATLDRVRITTVNGTDTFDAGSINIMYE